MRKTIGAVALATALLLSGCDGEYGTVKSLSPGNHKIRPAIYGLWYAEKAGNGCRWQIARPNKSIVAKGKWTLKNRTPAVQLGTGNKDMTFSANDKCGKWSNQS